MNKIITEKSAHQGWWTAHIEGATDGAEVFSAPTKHEAALKVAAFETGADWQDVINEEWTPEEHEKAVKWLKKATY